MENIIRAFDLAQRAHKGQFRKDVDDEGNPIPYIVHPVDVKNILAEVGAPERAQIIGLLHDVIEDAKPVFHDEISKWFGQEVFNEVMQCSDHVNNGRKNQKKAPWRKRKEDYIRHLPHISMECLLVVAADKISNLRALGDSLEKNGQSVFDAFHSSPADQKWFYEEVGLAVFEALSKGEYRDMAEKLLDMYGAAFNRVFGG